MDRFKRLILEVHRRSLWQVLSIYLVASWVGYQVISELTQGLGLPDWVPGFAVVLFLIGLPIVLATAFIQEGGPTRRDQPVVSYAPSDPTLLPLDLEPARSESPAHHALFTWKKAIAGGVVAFLLLGVTAGGYMGMRNAGIGPFGSLLAKGALDNRERVLIAEFSDLTGDTILAQAVTQAFRVSFAQSDVITVIEPSYVRTVLGRMQRPATSHLDEELAREVALRDNIKAYVTGEIARVGGRYSVIGKLLSSGDATVLATYAQEAADSTEILAAVDKLSRKLREKIGESLRAIRNDRPLAAVTTHSLEALRKYTQAEQAIELQVDLDRGVALLQEAVALDTAFAMAWRKLGVAYGNTDAPFAKVLEAQTNAYRHRDRLTDIERYLTAGSYHLSVTENLDQAEQAYRNALEVQPDHYVALTNIGVAYSGKRDFQRAREVTEKTVALHPRLYIPYGNLAEVLITLGNVDSAAAVAETLGRVVGKIAPYYYYKSEIAAAKRDYATVEQNTRELIRGADGQFARVTHVFNTAALAIQGRLADAERVLTELEQIERTQGVSHAALQHALAAADIDILIRQDPERALRRVDEALAREPLDNVAIENRPYTHLAGLYAASGHPERARPLLAEHMKLPREIRRDDRDRVSAAEGWIALAEKRYADAISHFRLATTLGACPRCEHVELGFALEGAQQPDSAIAHYEYWLNTPFGEEQIKQDAPRLATVYERLAELYERKGDRQKAAFYAGRLVELWKNADSELQPRVATARAMLQRLGGDRPR